MKKYIKETIWALSIVAFVACMIMSWAKGSISYAMAAGMFATIWVTLSINDYNDNENHLNEQKRRMHL